MSRIYKIKEICYGEDENASPFCVPCGNEWNCLQMEDFVVLEVNDVRGKR